ncbi:aminoacyl-histidine dipeptidase [Kordiimonas sediminis]|uniref:Aminoacyl-histidine dipeptidase n=1 Tax=Kordiimonas sediminis TaxID=1735581 RepID=A0A919E8L7_9PROT|nr:M20/M25/M40 family metallo-hydrolase [Kordiimonas sediminis]GHF24800.1 aminoacyl-histidine dipeptidase [Kordiimonas sediminis]
MLIKSLYLGASMALAATAFSGAVSASEPQSTEKAAAADAAIAALKANPKVQKAFDFIMAEEPQTQADLIELTEIPAPPFKEEKRGKRFAEMLKAAGADSVMIDEVGNVIAERKGTVGARTILIDAHLDTVFPEGTDVTVRFEGDKMYAPGIGDDTRGLVVLNMILKAINHADIRTKANLLFVGSVGEEGLGDLRGVKHLFRDGARKIDAFIAIDGGDIERVVYGAIGSHRYRIIFEGPGGHSWGAFGMANPHHAMGRAIAEFVANAPSVTSTGDKTSYNIGRMGGGTSINSIPFTSWAEVDMRSGNQSKLDDIDAVLQTAVQKALAEENAARLAGPELTLKMEKVGKRPAGKGDIDSDLLHAMQAALRTMGHTAKISSSSTDSNIPISKGIPAITISRGGIGGRAHSPDEWWQNVDGHQAIEAGLLTLVSIAGIAE